ncbi:MAG: discoidin domain-containing protein [Dehalococcoidia bacterium]
MTASTIRLGRWRGFSAIALVTASLALTLVACGDDGPEPAVSSIDGILDGAILVEDIRSDAANVRVVTTIPVVCAVVFGTDTSYGGISTDPDMGGAAHSDHFAPLRGLEPDTVYHYRLQGTGPDGMLYVSGDLTFRTAPRDPDQLDRGPNVASLTEGARVLEVSSVFGGSMAWRAENAVDGDTATEWSSDGDGDAAFITIELRDETRLTAVGLWSRTMGTSAEIKQFQVVTDRGETLGPFSLPDANGLHVFEVSALARSLRFEVLSSSGGNTGAVELAASGEVGP